MEEMVGMDHLVVEEVMSMHRRDPDWYFQRFPVAGQARFPLACIWVLSLMARHSLVPIFSKSGSPQVTIDWRATPQPQT